MLSIHISSPAGSLCGVVDPVTVVGVFMKHGLECTATVTHSSVMNTRCHASACFHEAGVHVTVHGKIDCAAFRDTAWAELQGKYDLKCAFVRYNHEYMGCINNWPGVFAKTNCPKNTATVLKPKHAHISP
jgi:hypothetical protein